MAAVHASAPPSFRVSSRAALLLPSLFICALLAFLLIDAVREHPRLRLTFVAAAAALFAWTVALWIRSRVRGRTLNLEIVLRPQHYVQACAHASIFLYWGWHWRQVYESFHLILAQLVFAYAFDMLLAWSRRNTYTLGFGPFPIIFSTNLFLWFKPDWFYLQFLMVAVGFAAKELIRWEKDGRRTHIFNPSSFSLSVFSIGLILAGASDVTWGQEIAVTQFYPPHMYLFLFLVALPGQFLFGVTTMTMSAVLTAYLFGLVYFAATGTYFFYDSYIPIAVFLGMHLLFTDPSTAPRSELGRVLFGALYATAVIAGYALLGRAGIPAFYDKLLPVPLLNLSIQALDRLARSPRLAWLNPARVASALVGRRRNLAYIAIWLLTFSAVSAARGLGDDHRGQFVPFWRDACERGNGHACAYLAGLQRLYCRQGSGWACNELAIMQLAHRGDWDAAATAVRRGCANGFQPACANVEKVRARVVPLDSAPPTLADYPIVLRGTKGPLTGWTPSALYERACKHGWPDTCGQTGSH